MEYSGGESRSMLYCSPNARIPRPRRRHLLHRPDRPDRLWDCDADSAVLRAALRRERPRVRRRARRLLLHAVRRDRAARETIRPHWAPAGVARDDAVQRRGLHAVRLRRFVLGVVFVPRRLRLRRRQHLVGAAFGIGFSAGPAVGGLADHYLGHAAPGLVAVGLSLANFVSAYIILPESLKHEHRVTRPLFDLRHIGEAIARPRLRPLMAVWALTPLGFAGYTAALPYRAIDTLGWKQLQLTFLFIIIGVTAAAVQGYFFGKVVRRTGERRLVIAGAFGMAIAIAVVPFVSSSGPLYA